MTKPHNNNEKQEQTIEIEIALLVTSKTGIAKKEDFP